jgi:antitoxin component YwqK of YwqJK toxin-antitoxin module
MLMVRLLITIGLLLSLALMTLQCNGVGDSSAVETVEVRDSIYGYVERFERRTDDFAKHGLYEKRDADGKLIETAFYENDTLNGPRVVFFETGDTQIVETYQMGIFEGPYRLYHENGAIELTGDYINNEMKGLWTRFYDNGAVMEKVQFENNEENGPFVEYYANGNLKAEGAYLNGDNEHGELKLYNEAGELIRVMNCDNGICRTQWKADSEE